MGKLIQWILGLLQSPVLVTATLCLLEHIARFCSSKLKLLSHIHTRKNCATNQCCGRIFNRKNVYKNIVQRKKPVSFLPSTDIYWTPPLCQIMHIHSLGSKVMAPSPVKFTVWL